MSQLHVQHEPLGRRLRRGDLRIYSRGATWYTVSSAAHYGLRAALGRQVRRDKAHVLTEYDNSARNEYWKTGASLSDLTFGNDAASKWILEDDRLVLGTDRTSRMYLLQRLVTRIRELLPDGRGRVTEFGCGVGRNLFHLRREFPDLELVGLELSPTTVAAANELVRRFDLRGIEILEADITKDVPRKGSDVAFSVHALEQLPSTFVPAVEQMIQCGRQGVIFYEPVHELFPYSLRGLAARWRIQTANHLDGLLKYLKGNPSTQVVRSGLLPTVGNPLNQTSEIVVKSVFD